MLVAHELEAAQAFADQMAVLDHGQILQTGPPAEVVAAPAARRVAELVGYRSFVPLAGGRRGRGGRRAPGPGAGGPLPGRGVVLAGPVRSCRPSGAGWEATIETAGTLVPVHLREQPGGGPEFAFTVLDPPCFGPDGLRVSPPRGGTHVTGLATAGAGAGRREAAAALRLARGYSQQQLAGMAGVSRQAVSAVEAGHSDPSLRVALALASALGVTVEEVFGPGIPVPVIGARPVAPLGGEGARVTLAQVGESFVALPLVADSAIRGRLPPGGRARRDAVRPGPGGSGAAAGPAPADPGGGGL